MRDNFRMGIMENLPISILLVPYAAVSFGRQYHPATFLFGIAFFLVYALIIYGYLKYIRENSTEAGSTGYGLMDICFDARGRGGILAALIYVIRYMLRAGFVGYVVYRLIRGLGLEYDRSLIAVCPIFILLAVYGAAGSYSKKAVLGNFLMYWMVVPLILILVLSISRMDYGDIAYIFSQFSISMDEVFGGAWTILALLSTLELILYSMGRTTKRQTGISWGQGYVRLVVWIVIAVTLSYVYMLGMLGRRYMTSESLRISFGTVIDYGLFLAWFIGAFYVAASYIFYAREFVIRLREPDSEGATGGKAWLINLLMFAGVLLFVYAFDYGVIRPYLLYYMVYGDVALTLLMPGYLIVARRIKYMKRRVLHD